MTFVVHHGDCREVMATLDAEAGTEGGPVDAAARAKWVRAYRAVSAAAAEASR